jgi:4-diphosphocytidyl-2-C-methyl-D-erythritol kinase
VYHEADRLGAGRTSAELAALDPQALRGVNDLEAAALSLEPSVAAALSRASEAGARQAMVCGSGPTVIGLFDEPGEAARAAGALRSAGVDARAARPFPRSATLPL